MDSYPSEGEQGRDPNLLEDITEKRELENKLSMHTNNLEKLVLNQVEQLENAERLSAQTK